MANSKKLKSGTELPILSLKGKDYLQVCWRLVWFNEERPGWSIETEFLKLDEKYSVCKATIKDETGRIMSTAHKQENVQGFPDHIEKSETGSIGRALALIGFGTQFSPDLDEGSRIVDSPIGGSRVVPEQPGPGDGIQEDGVKIPYGPLAGQFVHNVDPIRLRTYIVELEASWSARKLSEPPAWAREMVKAAEVRISAYENEINDGRVK